VANFVLKPVGKERNAIGWTAFVFVFWRNVVERWYTWFAVSVEHEETVDILNFVLFMLQQLNTLLIIDFSYCKKKHLKNAYVTCWIECFI